MTMELFLTKKRARAGTFIELMIGVVVMALAGLAYLLRNWRHLQLAISLPSLLAIPYILWVVFLLSLVFTLPSVFHSPFLLSLVRPSFSLAFTLPSLSHSPFLLSHFHPSFSLTYTLPSLPRSLFLLSRMHFDFFLTLFDYEWHSLYLPHLFLPLSHFSSPSLILFSPSHYSLTFLLLLTRSYYEWYSLYLLSISSLSLLLFFYFILFSSSQSCFLSSHFPSPSYSEKHSLYPSPHTSLSRSLIVSIIPLTFSHLPSLSLLSLNLLSL